MPHNATAIPHPLGGEGAPLDAEARCRFEALVREHEPALLSLGLRLCGNPDDARDVVQDTLECALRAFVRLNPGPETRAWLATVLKHRFLDRCRRLKPQSIEDLRDLDTHEALIAPELYDEPAWARVTSENLRAAMKRLPCDLRQVYELKVNEKLSYEEISKRLGIPKGTVGTRLMRARQHLKEFLASNFVSPHSRS